MFGAHPMLRTGGAVSYSVPYSLRFRRSNSAYLSRTMGTPTNNKICTWSFWAKRGTLGTTAGEVLFYSPTAAGGTVTILFDVTSPNALRMYGAGGSFNVTSASVYRDTSAWYHFVIVWNSPEATGSNRFKAWVNGESVSFSGTFPPQNQECSWNNSGTSYFGSAGGPFADSRDYIDGYRAECYFIDGQALTPSSFGQTDSATGVWVPKKYAGTYGNNGFYLKFADASAATATAIGKDSSGNGNNWTPSGISVTSGVTYDQMTDTPTLNYSVLNPLAKSSVGTLDNANMRWTTANSGPGTAGNGTRVSIGMSTGKWYAECTVLDTVFWAYPGISNESHSTATYNGGDVNSWAVAANGQKVTNASASAYGSATWAANDIVNIAYDADNGELYFGKNGTWLNSGNPATRTNPAFTGLSGVQFFTIGFSANTASASQVSFNCGQQPFSYTPPTGFKALNTANLPTPSIKKGSLYMDATLRTGTGATASVSSLGFQPNLVWIKSRSNGTAHNLFNSVRGATKGIQTTGPNAEYTDANSLTAFNANGYSLGSDASSRGVNINTNTYVDWAWKESTTAGLDILSWTGNGTGPRTINHALGVTPEFMMLRGTDARVWACWFNSMTSAAYYMDLGTAAAEAIDTTMFDSTAPTSTTFRVGSYNNVNALAYVGYFFSSIAGFSRIGSYTGNASTDGPFVWCGFRPKFVMVKGVDVATGWFMVNPSNSANEVVVRVFSDTTGAELSNTYGLDLLSNGFKVRAPSGYSLNNSGNKYAFIAYAENPFKYARAR